jgi:hypothetical protein
LMAVIENKMYHVLPDDNGKLEPSSIYLDTKTRINIQHKTHFETLLEVVSKLDIALRPGFSYTVLQIVYANKDLAGSEIEEQVTRRNTTDVQQNLLLIVRPDARSAHDVERCFSAPSHEGLVIEIPFNYETFSTSTGVGSYHSNLFSSWLSHAVSYKLNTLSTDGDMLLEYTNTILRDLNRSTGGQDLENSIAAHKNLGSIMTLLWRNEPSR